jgi:cytochrome c oxidase subunit III
MEIPYTVERRPDTGLYNAKIGVWLFLASEVMLFGALFSSYILLRVGADPGTWPHHWLDWHLGGFNTLVLILSSVANVLAWASLKMNQWGKYRKWQAVTMICAVVFMCVKSYEYYDKFHHYEVTLKDGRIADGHIVADKTTTNMVVLHGYWAPSHAALMDVPTDIKRDEIEIPRTDIAEMSNYGPSHNNFTGLYFTMTGLHVLHIIGGILVIFMLWGPLNGMWKTEPERYINRVEVAGLFWCFVDLVWIFLFPTLYLL